MGNEGREDLLSSSNEISHGRKKLSSESQKMFLGTRRDLARVVVVVAVVVVVVVG